MPCTRGGCAIPACLAPEGGVLSQYALQQEGCLVPGGSASGGGPGGDPPQMATAAGGTHPTGMHSCFWKSSHKLWFILAIRLAALLHHK